MRVFDSLSQKNKLLPKSKKEALRLFVCGPTVYDYSHIGHARTYIVFDAFVKHLRARGIKVFYLQNITDVDDKIIKRAREARVKPLVLAKKFKEEYFKDLKNLKVDSVNKYAEASKFIPEIIDQIQRLINKGHAYKIEGDGYYFDVSTFSEYGKLSKRTAEQADDAVSRIDKSIKKRNTGDFCLWKLNSELSTKDGSPPGTNTPWKCTSNERASNFKKISKTKFRITKDGEPAWRTSLGWGRPGWHIEDTAITEKFFGPQYDIHGGGVDLKFPHHEAEIAQQEAASGKKPLVKIWMHTGFLLVEGEKMSKSLGNFITVRNFLKKYPQEVLRIMVLSNHYRSPFNYTAELADQSKKSLATIEEFLSKLNFAQKARGRQNNSVTKQAKFKFKIRKYEAALKTALENDFNTPKALAVLFDLISETQKNIWGLSTKEVKTIADFIKKHLKTFEIEFGTEKVPAKITKMAQKREKLRRNKQFIQADQLRKEIEMLGYTVEDTPFGPFAKQKEMPNC